MSSISISSSSNRFVELLGTRLHTQLGKSIDTDKLFAVGNDKIVALYFSAKYCGPCKKFTSLLAKAYKELEAEDKLFEVVFVSRDTDQKEFEAYYKEHPWCAVPYKEQDLRDSLIDAYDVRGIPNLVILSPQGKLITKDGRADITKLGGTAAFASWTKRK